MSSDDTRIGIIGIGGRMGQAILREVSTTPGAALAGGTERPESNLLGKDPALLAGLPASGLEIMNDPLRLFAEADAVIDFSAPAAVAAHSALAAQAKTAYIVGMTGLEDMHFDLLRKAARHCCVVQSFNMSLGVNLLAGLVRQVAASLGDDWDIEIVEMHHRMKVDAPSGTAIMFGEAAAAGRGIDMKEMSESGRDGITGARKPGAIGFAALRGGNVAGEHTVIFAAENERLELTHKATDRSIFARGAVRCAMWSRAKPPGLYHMPDVLGLKTT